MLNYYFKDSRVSNWKYNNVRLWGLPIFTVKCICVISHINILPGEWKPKAHEQEDVDDRGTATGRQIIHIGRESARKIY